MAELAAPERTYPWIGRLRALRSPWILALPLLAAIVFVAAFSSPMPLTDEWFFTKGIVRMQYFDLHTLAGWSSALDALPRRFGEHLVVLPFFVYWPIAEWAHYDSRWIIYTSVACMGLELLLLRRGLALPALVALPIALLLFCPSHYMEFLWGWQLTVTLSLLFPVAGLVLVDRMPIRGTLGAKLLRLSGGCLLFLLGTLSSAGGIFGFPCAFLLVLLKPFPWREKCAWLGVLVLAALGVYLLLMYEPEHHFQPAGRLLPCLLTALGASIWGSPVGIFEFAVDHWSVTGFVILACTVAVVARAAFVGALPRLALPLSLVALGLLCMSAIALARTVLGNWHVQSVLLVPCGAYAAAWLLWKEDRSRFASVPFYTLCAVVSACLFSYFRGFSEYGPGYNAYIRSIEERARGYLVNPVEADPQTTVMDLDPRMLLFLSAHDHPLFRAKPGQQAALPQGARVFLNLKQVQPPFEVEVVRGNLPRLTVLLPVAARARYVRARIGGAELLLQRIHPRLTLLPGADQPGVLCYCGLLVPSVLPAGKQPVELSLLR
jgi:hypothetical protein